MFESDGLMSTQKIDKRSLNTFNMSKRVGVSNQFDRFV